MANDYNNTSNATKGWAGFQSSIPLICCGNCRFFTPDEKCHALPPEPKPSTGGYFFRATRANEWCGLHEVK